MRFAFKNLFFLSFLTVVALFVATKSSFAKQSSKNSLILVVDIEKVVNESLVGKDVQAKIQKEYSKIQKKIDEKKAELTKEAQDLQLKKSKLSASEYEEKTLNLQNKIMILDTKFQEDIESLQKKQQDIVQKIIDPAKEICSEIAKDMGVGLVVSSGAVLYSSTTNDITIDVIKKLDEKIKTIEI
jgi:outer membrane protein